jgi:hypothetical protein
VDRGLRRLASLFDPKRGTDGDHDQAHRLSNPARVRSPRSGSPNLIYFNEVDKGGHFAA